VRPLSEMLLQLILPMRFLAITWSPQAEHGFPYDITRIPPPPRPLALRFNSTPT
jgi:hypothetical protein